MAIKPIKNLFNYILLFFAIFFIVQNRNAFNLYIMNMPIWKYIIYGIAILIYLIYYISFWITEFSGWHITYEYINVNKELVIQRNDIIYSIILSMIHTNIMILQNVLPILSFILIIKAIFLQPLLYNFKLSWDE